MKSIDVRSRLVDALRLDLIGPSDTLGDAKEVLPQAPSRWYLSGFLVPLGADPSQRADEDSADDLDQAGEPGGGLDDDEQPERPAARQRYMPSSIGASLLVPASARHITVKASWGDYQRRSEAPEEWERTPREETISLDLSTANDQPRELDLPGTKGLKIAYLAR